MLKTWIPEEIPEKEELKKRIKEAGEKLYQQQMKLKEHKLPVLVLFEAGVHLAKVPQSAE